MRERVTVNHGGERYLSCGLATLTGMNGGALRMLAVHTVPVWDREGESVYGMEHYTEYGFAAQPEVVGWANVAVLELNGKVRELLLVHDG